MTRHHTAHLAVRIFDVDGWGELPMTALASYCEQTAWEASAALGFGDAWYREQGTAWVVRRLILARYAPIGYPDQVSVETWVSDARRVRAYREYAVRDPAGRLLAAGRGEWVYVDRVRQAPRAFGADLAARFRAGDPLDLPTPPPPLALPAPGREFVAGRRVYRYEADSMSHVNNAVYLAWLDEALAEALAAAGLPLAPVGRPGLRLVGTRYELDYVRSACPGDDLTIRSRLTGQVPDAPQLVWEQEIAGADGAVFLRCLSRQEVRGLAGAELDLASLLRALTTAQPATAPGNSNPT